MQDGRDQAPRRSGGTHSDAGSGDRDDPLFGRLPDEERQTGSGPDDILGRYGLLDDADEREQRGRSTDAEPRATRRRAAPSDGPASGHHRSPEAEPGDDGARPPSGGRRARRAAEPPDQDADAAEPTGRVGGSGRRRRDADRPHRRAASPDGPSTTGRSPVQPGPFQGTAPAGPARTPDGQPGPARPAPGPEWGPRDSRPAPGEAGPAERTDSIRQVPRRSPAEHPPGTSPAGTPGEHAPGTSPVGSPVQPGGPAPGRIPPSAPAPGPTTGRAPAQGPPRPADRPGPDGATETYPAVPAGAGRDIAEPDRPPAESAAEPDDAAPVDPRRDRSAGPDDPPAPEDPPGTAAAADEPPAAAPSGRGRSLRIAGAVAAALVLIVTAAGFAARNQVNGGIARVAALDPESDAIMSKANQAADENVLVLGLSADRGRVPEAARNDTAVVMHVPAGGGPAVTLSLPAALEVARPPCQSWDPATAGYGATIPAESRTVLGAAFDVGGPRCAVGAVQQLTGLSITRFVALDLAGAGALVDAVRGVPVCTERPVIDPASGPVVTRAGETVLAGAEATRFAGATGVDDTSPANRVQRQQRVLGSALDRALSTPNLLTPGAPTRIAQALEHALLVDNADIDEVLTVARSLGRAGTAGDEGTPLFLGAPVNDQPNTRGHLELRRSDAVDLFSAMRKHEPLPPEATAPAQRSATVAIPQGTTVDVLNGAGRAGLAGQVADSLRQQGYQVGSVSDAPTAPETLVRFSPDRADAAGQLAASVPSAVPAPDPTDSETLQLVLGSGFTGQLAPPAPPAADAVDCG